MSLFLGSMRQHIPGRKELTEKSQVLSLMPKENVYIPLIHGRSTADDFEVFVSEGDEVKVGTKLAQTLSLIHI